MSQAPRGLISRSISENKGPREDFFARHKQANLPETSPEMLEQIAQNADNTLLQEMTRNPNLPLALFFRLGENFPRHFLENPVLPLLLLERPAFLHEMPIPTFLRLLEIDNLPLVFLEWGVTHTDARVREAVAYHRKTPAALLSKLAGDSSFRVCLALAKHPKASEELLLQLAGTLYPEIRRAVSSHPKLPAQFLDFLCRAGASSDLSAYTKVDSSLSWEELSPLLQEGPYLRSLVARHPRTPRESLEQLLEDHEAIVRESALRNPKTLLGKNLGGSL